METATTFLAFFLGQGTGISMTLEAKGNMGRLALCTRGGGDWHEPSPRLCCKQKEEKLEK